MHLASKIRSWPYKLGLMKAARTDPKTDLNSGRRPALESLADGICGRAPRGNPAGGQAGTPRVPPTRLGASFRGNNFLQSPPGEGAHPHHSLACSSSFYFWPRRWLAEGWGGLEGLRERRRNHETTPTTTPSDRTSLKGGRGARLPQAHPNTHGSRRRRESARAGGLRGR